MSSWEVVAIRKVHSNGRIHIPKDIRKRLELKDGDRVLWVSDPAGRFYIANPKKKGERFSFG